MSIQKTIKVTCPGCHAESDFPMWQSINTAVDPGMKEAVRNKQAFRFCCPHCSEENIVDYSFLYHQPEEKWLIQYDKDDESANEFLSMVTEEDSSLRQFIEDGYVIRLVRSQNELIEKLFILDEGLDDRLVEIYKVLVLLRYQEEHKGEDIDRPVLYFYRSADKQPEIQVLINNEYQCSTTFNPDLYQDLQTNFSPRLSPLNQDTPVINEQWAFNFLL